MKHLAQDHGLVTGGSLAALLLLWLVARWLVRLAWEAVEAEAVLVLKVSRIRVNLRLYISPRKGA